MSAHRTSRILVRLSGEVSTKARATRKQCVARLLHNMQDALAEAGTPARVHSRYDRMFVDAGDAACAADALTRVFGIQSLSIAAEGPGETLDEVVSMGDACFRERVAGRRFAVRARRVGTPRPGTPRAREVEVALGERLRGVSAGVDLERPEVCARVELYEGRAYFFDETLKGEGGLPVGSSGRALALVSGGFDSAVAAWQMLRRGVALDYLFCNIGGSEHRLAGLRVIRALNRRWGYGIRPYLHIVEFGEIARDLQEKSAARFWQVILKRRMLRAAERVASQRGALALVTGEAIGQVSSQTLVNLKTIGAGAALPILRPLAGANKGEIIEQAHRIGTGALSAGVEEYCALTPRRPATAARLGRVEAEESALDDALLERAVQGREVIDLRAAEAAATAETGSALETDHVPESAVVIDLRTQDAYRQWHYPDAVNLDFGDAIQAHGSFAKDRVYVAYCEHGAMSAHLAERMRAAGLHAYHFRGGSRALRRLAEQAEQAKPESA